LSRGWLAADFETDVADGLLVGDGVGWRQRILRNRVFRKNPVSSGRVNLEKMAK